LSLTNNDILTNCYSFSESNNGVTLKSGFGVIQGNWKWYHSHSKAWVIYSNYFSCGSYQSREDDSEHRRFWQDQAEACRHGRESCLARWTR